MSNHQMASIPQFIANLHRVAGTNKWNPNRAAELNTIAGLLATDPTRRPTEVQTAPAGLRPYNKANTTFTNDVLYYVNQGKAGNLLPVDMGNAITAELSKLFPPVQTSAPAISGTGTVGQTLTCTTGNWTYSPTSYTYQWRRGGANISGATASTHVNVAADSGTTLTCVVTAHNAAGATASSPSNGIAVT